MTEPDLGGDLSYDSAHDARAAQPPPPARSATPVPPEVPGEQDGDLSYDLAHDVPRG